MASWAPRTFSTSITRIKKGKGKGKEDLNATCEITRFALSEHMPI